jgi:plastocyanin
MNGWRRASAGLVLGTVVVVATACKKGGEAAPAAGGAPAAAAPVAFPVSDNDAATITGRVAFTGAKPAAQRIDMSEEPTCAQKHAGGAFSETVVVNDNGTLRNVFVYVKSGLPATLTFPVPGEPVEIDQDGCQYTPHVFGVQVGQTMNIKNADGLLHNIKALPTINRPFNISQPISMTTPRTFSAPEVMVPLQCNVHSWMNAFVGVLPHPYYSVTGADGTFSLRRLPPGTYVIEAWQEHYPAQTQTVTVGAKESKAIVFTFHS